MTFSRRQRWVAALALGSALLLAWLALRERPEPKLALTYLSRTNKSGIIIVTFAVTNTGTAAAISEGQGALELSGQTSEVSSTSDPNHHRLAPGAGGIIQVWVPEPFKGRWRYTCAYAHEDMQTLIYDWLSQNHCSH